MLHALIVDGELCRVVDSPTALDKLTPGWAQAMCQQLQVPWRGVNGRRVQIVPITADMVVSWDVPKAKQA